MTTLAHVTPSTVHTSEALTCWDETVVLAETVGNWIADAAVRTAVWIKEAAIWIAEGAVIVYDFLCDTAIKVYEFLAPYFAAIGQWIADVAVALADASVSAYNFTAEFINAHPNETVVGLSALVIGAVAALVIEKLCCCCC